MTKLEQNFQEFVERIIEYGAGRELEYQDNLFYLTCKHCKTLRDADDFEYNKYIERVVCNWCHDDINKKNKTNTNGENQNATS